MDPLQNMPAGGIHVINMNWVDIVELTRVTTPSAGRLLLISPPNGLNPILGLYK